MFLDKCILWKNWVKIGGIAGSGFSEMFFCQREEDEQASVRCINHLFQSFIILPQTQYLTRVLNLVTNSVCSNSLIRFHLMFIKSGIVLHFQFPKMTFLHNLWVIK